MSTITKMIDLRLIDHEVEIDLDADDLEEFEPEELWEALTINRSAATVAKLVAEDDSVVSQLVENMDASDLVDANEADITEEVMKRLTTGQRKELLQEWITDDSGLLEWVRGELAGLGDEADVGAEHSERVVTLFDAGNEVQRRSVLNHVVGVMPIDDVAHALRSTTATLTEAVRALCAHHDPQTVLCVAFAAALARCEAARS